MERSPPSRSFLTESNSSLVLAAERTRRRDPLDGNKFYTGGWDISEYRYWTVSFFLYKIRYQIYNNAGVFK